MQTYAQMKDSGVSWLGDIPAEWNVLPLYGYVEEKKQKNVDNTETNVLSLSYGKIIKRNLDSGGLLPESFATYQIVQPDDIILRLTDLQNDKRSLRVGRATQTGIITPAYVCITPTKLNSKYLYYLLHGYDLLKVFYNLGGGLRQGMKFDDLKRLPVFDISIEKQQEIANYLDQETARIDDLIAKQERLLELLEEKRRARITHAVTRGLNPNVELKETLVPWLGQIPAHWELKKLKNTIKSQKNGVWGSDANGGDNDIHCIRVADFDRYNLRVSEGKFTQRSIEEKDRLGRLLHKGDLLFEKSGGGDNQLVGQVVKYESDEPAVTSNFVSRLEVADGYNVDFLVFLNAGLYYQRVNYRSIKQTSGIQNIDSQAYFNESVGIPTLEEQREIAENLLNENRLVENTNEKIYKQISLLKERRTSLISHAVTGKIKV